MGQAILIGVTGPSRGIRWAWWASRWQLRRCGARSRYLHAGTGYPEADFAGFIIGGGNDIDPGIYGGDVSASRNVDPLRDEFELSVLNLAAERDLPVMGICRGAQLLNVHAGGTLHSDLRDIRQHTSNKGTLLPRKQVAVEPGSKLATMLGSERTRVNSLHHQSVKTLGDGLVVSARDRDEIVQGIEALDAPLRIGVQWHPEYMPQRHDQHQLFQSFVDYCRNRSSR